MTGPELSCPNLIGMALVTNVVKGSSAERLLLLVHGYGADEQDLGGLLPYLDPDGVFAAVMPRAPIAAPGTPGYMWYDMAGGGDITEQFTTALAELDALVDEQCEALGFDRSSAVFAGFSQGGGLALALGLFSAPDGLAAGSARRCARDEPGRDDRSGRRRRTGCSRPRAARHERPADPRATFA